MASLIQLQDGTILRDSPEERFLMEEAAGPGTKARVHVRPYVREGRPVAGYMREMDLSILWQRLGEQTGIPEIDDAIKEFGHQDEFHSDYFGEDVPMSALRSPEEAAGMCSEVSRAFADFLQARGVNAYDSGAEVNAPDYPHPRNPLLGSDFGPDAFGYHDRKLEGSEEYPEHSATVIEHSDDIYLVDWAAAQYGYTEFPLVQRFAVESPRLTPPRTIPEDEVEAWLQGAAFGRVMYHGTQRSSLQSIQESGLRDEAFGIWLTDSPEEADKYAQGRFPVSGGAGAVVKAAVRLDKPFVVDYRNDPYTPGRSEALRSALANAGIDPDVALDTEAVRAAGFDGRVLLRPDGSTDVEVLNPDAVRVIVPASGKTGGKDR